MVPHAIIVLTSSGSNDRGYKVAALESQLHELLHTKY